MVGQLNLNQLKTFAPQSPILVFRPADSGSPMQDWCRHLSENASHRRELEEFAVLGDVVVRIADELEPEPLERVKIMSLEYAIRTLGNEVDGREFVRCVRAISSPDASQYEYEQIAAYYYREIRRRGAPEVLKEMGLLGIHMESVTSTNADREIDVVETEIGEQKLTVADQRRSREAAKKRRPLPPGTPNYDDEMAAVLHRVGRHKVRRMIYDDFADYFLNDGGKTIEDLDQDFLTYEALEQYDENGIVGFSMNSGQRSVIVYDFEAEVDPTYLPADLRPLATQLAKMFVGHSIGGAAAQDARHFLAVSEAQRQNELAHPNGCGVAGNSVLPVASYSRDPISDREFSEWLAAVLDAVYDRRTVRSVRRIRSFKNGSFEYVSAQEVNPDYEEMQYVTAVFQILWHRQKADFHLKSLRNAAYHDLYVSIRKTTDTAEVAELKKESYSDFKAKNRLTLKEFTALNTVAKSQESRLADMISPTTRRLLRTIATSSQNRLRFLKYSLYNDRDIQALTRQEKQRLWDAVRARESELQTESRSINRSLQRELFKTNSVQTPRVKVNPIAVQAA